MRVFVTGPWGFVGARIMDELGRDAIPAPSLRTVDEEGIRRIVDAAQPDLIIHTAAVSACQCGDPCLACPYRCQVRHVQH